MNKMSNKDWETIFNNWKNPPSDTEEQKCTNAEGMIRDAIRNNPNDNFSIPIVLFSDNISNLIEAPTLTVDKNIIYYHQKTTNYHKIMMRYIHLPIDATMQIRYNGRVFEVIGDPINWMERNIFIQFNCSENFEHDVNHPE